MKSTWFAAGLMAVFMCVSLQAQPIHMKADIPFEFEIGSKLMPAGTYIVQKSPNHALCLRAATGGAGVFILTNAAERPKAEPSGTLIFNRYGNAYFLSRVWVAGSNTGVVLWPNVRERQLVAASSAVQVASVKADLK